MRTFFPDLQATGSNHFKLCFYSAVFRIIHYADGVVGGPTASLERYPFLASYLEELAHAGLGSMPLADAIAELDRRLLAWEQAAAAHLPLRALTTAAGLHDAVHILVLAGAVEEDARLGFIFDDLQGTSSHRPVVGLLQQWFGEDGAFSLQLLQRLGLLQVADADLPRASRSLRVPGVIWDVIRNGSGAALPPSMTLLPPESLTLLSEYIAEPQVLRQVQRVPELLRDRTVRALVVRGPNHNGRRTLAGSIARHLGCGVLHVDSLLRPDDERWRVLGSLAALLKAIPVLSCELSPGETAEIPCLLPETPVIVIMNRFGGITGPLSEQSLTVTLSIPEPEQRRRHWSLASGITDSWIHSVATRLRLTTGNIRRAAKLATSCAVAEAVPLAPVHLRQATGILGCQSLDRFAKRIETAGDWSLIAVPEQTRTELLHLESRCRHREQLKHAVGPAAAENLNSGVRALFSGPSGTGKTLAAQLLAASLNMDLYRLDLSTVVNKYIGETEKHLDQVFSRAEELDVILLLDEGDALMTQRTNVQTSNDRYANLETNYLLQRLDSFEGVLVVTTNAAARIDSAFQRRMDIVVQFRLPEPADRLAIWQMHLPHKHDVDYARLEEIADRCGLSGGQIRNASLHAAMLALDDGGVMRSAHLDAAVHREYVKCGGVCPLPRMALSAGAW